MAISAEQYNRILSRLNKIEDTLADVLTILSKVTTAATISRVITTFETELEDIRERLENAESSITELESDPFEEQEN